MAEKRVKRGMGWRPDYPDFRDYTIEQGEVSPTSKAIGQEDSPGIV
jgi:hypothetical protein